MAFDPRDYVAFQWDWLYETLKGEMTGGRLTAAKAITKSFHLWTGKTPAIGVQYKKWEPIQEFNAKRIIRTTFWVLVGAQSTPASIVNWPGYDPAANQPPNLDDADWQVRQVVSDGSGNGIRPIILDPNNRNAGGFGMRVGVMSGEADWQITPGAKGQIWAYELVEVVIDQEILIQ